MTRAPCHRVSANGPDGRRGAALLVVLATLVLVTSATAALARVASLETEGAGTARDRPPLRGDLQGLEMLRIPWPARPPDRALTGEAGASAPRDPWQTNHP